MDLEANQIAKIIDLSRNTINKYFKAFCKCIVEICEQGSPLSGKIEVDESYFEVRKIKGKCGCGACRKTIQKERDCEVV